MSENELDILLADWAIRNELSPVRAEAIRLAARPATTELPRQWWKELFYSLRESTDPRRYVTPLPNS